MENNRIPKNRYNGGAATDADKQDKPDVLKMIETAMDKRAAGIAQTVTDMFRFMSMASAMLPNMEMDVGVFRLKIDDDGVFFEIRYPSGFRRKHKPDEDGEKLPDNYDDDEEGLLYDGD